MVMFGCSFAIVVVACVDCLNVVCLCCVIDGLMLLRVVWFVI